MSLDDLLERESLGDDRLQAAISQALVDKTFTTLQTLQPGRVERDLRQPKAAQDDGLSHQLQGGHSRRLRTQGPVVEDSIERTGESPQRPLGVTRPSTEWLRVSFRNFSFLTAPVPLQ